MKHVCKIVLICAIVFTAGCKKYDDGPAFSLMTKKARLSNVWQVEKYILNGTDKTTDYRALISRERMEIYHSGKFHYSEVSTWLWAAPDYSGTWSFADSKEGIEMKPDNTSMKTLSYHILKLKKDELWMERQVSPDSLVEYHYIPVSQY
ncbi:MAG: hypothetical protein ACJ77K_18675 [Bacteroidia bacterium]